MQKPDIHVCSSSNSERAILIIVGAHGVNDVDGCMLMCDERATRFFNLRVIGGSSAELPREGTLWKPKNSNPRNQTVHFSPTEQNHATTMTAAAPARAQEETPKAEQDNMTSPTLDLQVTTTPEMDGQSFEALMKERTRVSTSVVGVIWGAPPFYPYHFSHSLMYSFLDSQRTTRV